jgi:hypothetical protein
MTYVPFVLALGTTVAVLTNRRQPAVRVARRRRAG